MLRVEDIHAIKMALISDNGRKDRFIQFCHLILENENYNYWLENGQYTEERFFIPKDFRVNHVMTKRVFDELGLIEDEILQVKIDLHEGKIHLTDGLWIPSPFRVFPFKDESERLVEYINKNNLRDWATVLIDPATGCGHHINAFSHVKDKIGFDINVRAVAYADLNRVINNTANCIIGINDIFNGLPNSLSKNLDGNILFSINMPFALAPVRNVLPLSADGGETGANNTFAALQAVKDFANNNSRANNIKLCILNYSVGHLSSNKWETVEFANRLFGNKNVTFKLLESEKMWRINGKKEQENPMPLEKLHLKAECHYYVDDSRRDEVREGYKNLEQKLFEFGWDVLGYGIIQVEVR